MQLRLAVCVAVLAVSACGYAAALVPATLPTCGCREMPGTSSGGFNSTTGTASTSSKCRGGMEPGVFSGGKVQGECCEWTEDFKKVATGPQFEIVLVASATCELHPRKFEKLDSSTCEDVLHSLENKHSSHSSYPDEIEWHSYDIDKAGFGSMTEESSGSDPSGCSAQVRFEGRDLENFKFNTNNFSPTLCSSDRPCICKKYSSSSDPCGTVTCKLADGQVTGTVETSTGGSGPFETQHRCMSNSEHERLASVVNAVGGALVAMYVCCGVCCCGGIAVGLYLFISANNKPRPRKPSAQNIVVQTNAGPSMPTAVPQQGGSVTTAHVQQVQQPQQIQIMMGQPQTLVGQPQIVGQPQVFGQPGVGQPIMVPQPVVNKV